MTDDIVKVRMSRELVERFWARTDDGARVTVEWGEPDAEGFHEPIFTRHDDDKLVPPAADATPGCECEPMHVWPCPTIPRCDEPGCEQEATCGWPSDSGYRRTCGKHMREALHEWAVAHGAMPENPA